MRYQPDDAAFAGDFIEFSDSWSSAQVRAAWDALDGEDAEAKLLDCLRPKIVALHLTCVDANAITVAGDLTVERTEQVDQRLYQWFAGVWIRHLTELSTLGNALRGRLFVTSVPAQTTKEAKHRQRR